MDEILGGLLDLALQCGLEWGLSQESPGFTPPPGYKLGRTYDRDDLIAISSQVIEMRPHEAQAYFVRGMVLQTQGLIPEAIDDLRQATRLDPNHARAGLLLTEALAKERDYEQAGRHASEPSNSTLGWGRCRHFSWGRGSCRVKGTGPSTRQSRQLGKPRGDLYEATALPTSA
jgi:tetratricopeptide (TPR) repeat protein